jgi:uncharacterized protein (DUF362 family)
VGNSRRDDNEKLFSGIVDRRTFLEGTIKTGALAYMGFSLPVPISIVPEPKRTTLAYAHGTNYRNLVIDVVDALGCMKNFIQGGERVMVKPNIGWDRVPELGANTHPEVVKTVVELCLDAGADQILVFDYSCDDSRRSYNTSGIKDAVESLKSPKVIVEYIENKKMVKREIPGAKALKKWSFFKDALDVDKFISIPVAKSHSITTVTASMKGLIGVIGGNRGQIHWGIDEKIADLATFIKPNLIVLDGTRTMFRNGPKRGTMKDVKVHNIMAAGTDPVAVDSYAALLLGLEGSTIGHIKAAYNRGLGEIDLTKIRAVNAGRG